MSVQFYQCKKCKKFVDLIQSSACPTLCCGEEMALLKANTTDGAVEKHVPVVSVKGSEIEVKVGSVFHPMESDHWIQFVALESEQGVQRKILHPGEEPVARFALLEGDKALSVYEFCNKHGLWKADV